MALEGVNERLKGKIRRGSNEREKEGVRKRGGRG